MLMRSQYLQISHNQGKTRKSILGIDFFNSVMNSTNQVSVGAISPISSTAITYIFWFLGIDRNSI